MTICKNRPVGFSLFIPSEARFSRPWRGGTTTTETDTIETTTSTTDWREDDPVLFTLAADHGEATQSALPAFCCPHARRGPKGRPAARAG